MNIIKVGAVVSALGILGGCTTTQNGEWAPSTDTCAAIGAVAGATTGVLLGGQIVGAVVGGGSGGVMGEVLCARPPLDSDGDGVIDQIDQCPGTPPGVAVNATGCARDADGDGVPDLADQCPATPKGAVVGANGCALDSDNDGVPDHLDKCPATPAGTLRVDAHGCAPQLVINHIVYFEFDKSEINRAGQEGLDEVAALLEASPGYRVRIAGHADAIGSASYNERLSAERAQAVINYLVAQGIDRSRFAIVAEGEEDPAASNATDGGRALNRRVEFQVLDR